jgi:hypothetical protein
VTDTGALGYFGLSMGTEMGIAFPAAEPRVRCAVLGLMHTHYYEEIVADAGRIRCPARPSSLRRVGVARGRVDPAAG